MVDNRFRRLTLAAPPTFQRRERLLLRRESCDEDSRNWTGPEVFAAGLWNTQHGLKENETWLFPRSPASRPPAQC